MAISIAQVLSHWMHHFPDFKMSSEEFYKEVEKRIGAHRPPGATSSIVTWKEGGIFSASRDYLRIKREHLVFDICAAPFGTDFFVSWWMYESEGLTRQLFKFAKFGDYLAQRAAKRTFFQSDTESMFRQCVHNGIMEALDDMTKAQGIRQLTELERTVKEGGVR